MSQPFVREGVDFSEPAAVDSAALLAAGKTFCGRYISNEPGEKILTLAEAISRSRAGLDLFSNYETTGVDFEDGYQAGVAAGNAALAGAAQVHQPPGTPIYFSADTDIDRDFNPGLLDALQAYLEGCASVVRPTYAVGVYGSSDALDAMASRGAAQFFWQSESTGYSGGRNANLDPNDNLWQYIGGTTVPQTDNDHAVQAYFGQWRAPVITTDLYAVWRGAGNDQGIWWSTFNGHQWAAQQEVPDVGSSDGPAVALFGGILYMAWKGRADDPDLWWTTFDGQTWAAQKVVPGTGSNARPALALFRGQLQMTWRGAAGDESLYWATFDGSAWTSQQQIKNVGSTDGPALAVYDSTLYMAWRGAGDDESLWWTTFDGTAWAPQRRIPGITSAACPALALFDNRLYLTARGAGSDESLYWTTFDGSTWAARQQIAGTGSSQGPGLAVFNDSLYQSWRGAGGDESLWWTTFDGKNWAPQQRVPNTGSVMGPGLLAP